MAWHCVENIRENDRSNAGTKAFTSPLLSQGLLNREHLTGDDMFMTYENSRCYHSFSVRVVILESYLKQLLCASGWGKDDYDIQKWLISP